jgi:hypothetical protein
MVPILVTPRLPSLASRNNNYGGALLSSASILFDLYNLPVLLLVCNPLGVQSLSV